VLLRKSDLLGLAIGFALGGALLAGYLRHIEAASRPSPRPHFADFQASDETTSPPIELQRYVPPVAQSAPPDRFAALAPRC
jgi:hypothetical protein